MDRGVASDRASTVAQGGKAEELLVSVVIPTFDRRDLVVQAIESALAQTETRIEILVVDDGSTDGTAQCLVERYGARRRLRVISQPNGGTAAARNRGLHEARARWTAFLDSDDLWTPDHLECQLRFAAQRPGADLYICDARFEGPWGRQEPTVFSRRAWRVPDSLDAMLNGAWALPSTMLLRTQVGRELQFSTRYRHSEDTEFLFRFHAAGHRLIENPAVLSAWRRHDGEGGAPQKMERGDAMSLEHLRMLETYAPLATSPRRVRYQIARKRALLHVRDGQWGSARRHLWTWWRMRPDSTRALRYLLTSLVRRSRPTAAVNER